MFALSLLKLYSLSLFFIPPLHVSLCQAKSHWATIWANLTTPDQAKEHVINNTHAPAAIRANAVLSSMDDFYECYDIKAGDQMYVAPENRGGIWQTK